jgi:hypothetical protein
LDDRVPLCPELAQALEVRPIVDGAGDVMGRQLPHLTVDPRSVDGDRALRRAERGDDGGNRGVVERDAGELGE